MCLIQNTDYDRVLTLSSGRLCVPDMPFLHAKEYRITVDGTEVGGIVGLGPYSHSLAGTAYSNKYDSNLVWRMYHEEVIDYPIVGINYEPWGVRGLQSKLTFGYLDYTQIEDGEDGLNYYSNLGRDNWGLMMDDFMYNGIDMTEGQGPKVAIIDSGNVTLQLPEFVFDNMLTEVKNEEGEGLRFYSVTNFDGSITMEADKPCS